MNDKDRKIVIMMECPGMEGLEMEMEMRLMSMTGGSLKINSSRLITLTVMAYPVNFTMK